MSRIGKKPISIPKGVEINVADNNVITVKGPKGTLSQKVDADLKVTMEDGILTLERPADTKRLRSMHGLYRSLVHNMITGVTTGFTTKQELVGVGYKAVAEGQILDLTLGFSHHIYLQVPAEVKIKAEQEKGKNPLITMESVDKQLLGQVAAKIRSLRKPEPFKGKGIRFQGEVLRKKAGKSAGK